MTTPDPPLLKCASCGDLQTVDPDEIGPRARPQCSRCRGPLVLAEPAVEES